MSRVIETDNYDLWRTGSIYIYILLYMSTKGRHSLWTLFTYSLSGFNW